MPFLPITKKEMTALGWSEADFIIVTGDAYVDHPSFGTAIISRVLEAEGYRVCIISQPRSDEDYKRFGKPRLAFLVNSGNIDSMVAHYTAAKKRRSDDAYTPGGKAGARPDRAVTVYTKKLRQLYGDVAIAIGGIEASLRRFAHYDYWSDNVRPSVLIESGADLLMFGMGEKHIAEIANRLNSGENIKSLTDIRGTCYTVDSKDFNHIEGAVECPSFELVSADNPKSKEQYAVSCRIQQQEQDATRGKTVIQKHGKVILVQNPPMPPLTTEEMDKVYSLPFMRDYHPSYEQFGGVPGIEEVKFSIIHNRGCYGACNFCSLAYHQGRQIAVRSHESVIEEAKKITEMPDFKGYIHDVGGPTANFRYPACKKQITEGVCANRKCLVPTPCKNLIADHSEYIELLNKIQTLPKVKKVFIRSGIRFDYMLCDKDDSFFKKLVSEHVSGQLKVAPEHCSSNVLKYMGKPDISTYDKFYKKYFELCKKFGLEQYLVPYLMSSHPGSTVKDAVELALYLKKMGCNPEQVQDFYPTPGTASTVMYYTGINPLDMKKVYCPTDYREKQMQRALLQYGKPENRNLVREALKLAGREDLIGFEGSCLVKPDMRVGSDYMKSQQNSGKTKNDKKQQNSSKNQKTAKNSQNKTSSNKAKTNLNGKGKKSFSKDINKNNSKNNSKNISKNNTKFSNKKKK